MTLATLLAAVLLFLAAVTFLTYAVSVSAAGIYLRIYASVYLGRHAQYLVYCPICTSFWVGLALGLAGLAPLQPALSLTGALFGPVFAVAFTHLLKAAIPDFLHLDTEAEHNVIGFIRDTRDPK